MKFRASFAGDLSPEAAAFMADSQVPWGVEALSGTITEAAWRTKPSWYLVATEDKMIPPTRSAPCRSGPVRWLSRSKAAMPSTCRSPRRWLPSSRRPRGAWPRRRSRELGHHWEIAPRRLRGRGATVLAGLGDRTRDLVNAILLGSRLSGPPALRPRATQLLARARTSGRCRTSATNLASNGEALSFRQTRENAIGR